MAFFELNYSAQQAQELRALKQSLITAINLSANIKRQMEQMTHAQQQSQFGIPAELSEAAFESTINDVVTALDAPAIQNLISQMG